MMEWTFRFIKKDTIRVAIIPRFILPIPNCVLAVTGCKIVLVILKQLERSVQRFSIGNEQGWNKITVGLLLRAWKGVIDRGNIY